MDEDFQCDQCGDAIADPKVQCIKLCNILGDHRAFSNFVDYVLNKPNEMAMPPKNDAETVKMIRQAFDLLQEALSE